MAQRQNDCLACMAKINTQYWKGEGIKLKERKCDADNCFVGSIMLTYTEKNEFSAFYAER